MLGTPSYSFLFTSTFCPCVLYYFIFMLFIWFWLLVCFYSNPCQNLSKIILLFFMKSVQRYVLCVFRKFLLHMLECFYSWTSPWFLPFSLEYCQYLPSERVDVSHHLLRFGSFQICIWRIVQHFPVTGGQSSDVVLTN